ncbi:unnamed protein product [Didymodactylos carnosus]|uniref:Uncharacterized protein n=1 Tax=Didymodactylos carnosus TaxID=1234261 RepID=A0A816D350_9BILA|nr:unnamed protein product [Didymodactylos carnosus]CAF1632933.1 unnamed protein product [Didymodactylos carnosus]CAF3618936.1 unnamed protein product [Didymodactylos carnosus]CAF4534406.1 unnamed protein product [Didymodactylos carnosus]
MCGTCRKGYYDFLHDYCMKEISTVIDQRRANRQRATTTTTNVQTANEDDDNKEEPSSDEDSNADADTDTDEDFVLSDDKESTKLLREALSHLLDLRGNKNRTWVTHNYRELTEQTRLSYLSRARSIVKSVIRERC